MKCILNQCHFFCRSNFSLSNVRVLHRSWGVLRQNDLYKYPDIYVCLYNFYGCDTMGLEPDCMYSYNQTEGGRANATFNPGGDEEQDIATNALLTESVRYWSSICKGVGGTLYGPEVHDK